MLRPLSGLVKATRSRALAGLDRLRGGVNEAVRVAEETQTFGVVAALRERIERTATEFGRLLRSPVPCPPHHCRLPEPDLLVRRWRPHRPLPDRSRARGRARRGGPAAGAGRDLRPAGPGRLPVRAPGAPLLGATARGRTSLPRKHSPPARALPAMRASPSTASALPTGAIRCSLTFPSRSPGRSHRHGWPIRRRKVDAGPDPARAAKPCSGLTSSTMSPPSSSPARLARAGRLRPPAAAPAAHYRRGQHQVLPRPRRRGGRTRRGCWPESTTRSRAGRRATRRWSALVPTPFPAASSSGSASPVLSLPSPTCSCSTSRPARSTRIRSR